MIFIEFASKFAGKVYPHARIKQRKYRKSPENLTEIGKALRALFSPPESVLKRVTRNNKKEMSKWQKEVFIMHADRQSESELIHSRVIKPKK